MPKLEDLTGKNFGRLTVINRCENISGRVAWNCICECGNEAKVISKSLKNGNTKSCGCLHKELVGKQFSKNISNKRFGSLVAIEPTKERKHGSIVWKCLCDCGNIHYATAELLLAGKVKSCGCIKSRGNQKIKEILLNNNFNFIDEYLIRINSINYYYDFAIFENNTLKCFIEYDGVLHFERDDYHGWNNEQTWEKTKRNDEIKNKYCIENNIKLIRIPYYDYDNIDLNYLLERMNK